MDHPIEIYSLDFDKQYLEEEEIIKRMDNFQVTGANEPIFLPFRKAGDQFWQSVKVADEIKTKTEAIKAQIKKFDEQLQALVTEEQALNEYQATTEHAADAPVPARTQELISELRN